MSNFKLFYLQKVGGIFVQGIPHPKKGVYIPPSPPPPPPGFTPVRMNFYSLMGRTAFPGRKKMLADLPNKLVGRGFMLLFNRLPTISRPLADWSWTNCQLFSRTVLYAGISIHWLKGQLSLDKRTARHYLQPTKIYKATATQRKRPVADLSTTSQNVCLAVGCYRGCRKVFRSLQKFVLSCYRFWSADR